MSPLSPGAIRWAKLPPAGPHPQPSSNPRQNGDLKAQRMSQNAVSTKEPWEHRTSSTQRRLEGEVLNAASFKAQHCRLSQHQRCMLLRAALWDVPFHPRWTERVSVALPVPWKWRDFPSAGSVVPAAFFFSSSERNSHRAIFCCLKCRCRNQPSLRYASCEIPTAALVFPADPLLRFSFSYQASVLHTLLLLQLLCHTIPPPRALSPAQIHAEGWP